MALTLRSLIARFWIYLVLPIAGAALAFVFVVAVGDSHRATAELKIDPLSRGLASMTLPNLPNTSLAKTEDGVRIVAIGSTPNAASEMVQNMARLLMDEGVEERDRGTTGTSDRLSEELDRERLAQLTDETNLLKRYAAALESSGESALQASSEDELATTASALVEVLRLIQSNEVRISFIDRRLRYPIPMQEVEVQTSTLPQSPTMAILAGLLGGLFAAFTASALLTFSRRSAAWE